MATATLNTRVKRMEKRLRAMEIALGIETPVCPLCKQRIKELSE